jgi:hypothetical protein
MGIPPPGGRLSHVWPETRTDSKCVFNFSTAERSSEKSRVTLRLAVYRQSVRLGDKPLETHGQ